jgi:transposase
VISDLRACLLCSVIAGAGVVAETDADESVQDVLAAALEANERPARLAEGLTAENARLREENARLRERDALREAELERLRAELAVLRRLVFGRSSERARPAATRDEDGGGAGRDLAGGRGGRPRGPGARAGRRDYSHLPRVEVIWDFPGGRYCCPQCGVPFTRLGDHVVEQLDWEVRVRVLAHCRRRYRRACRCPVPVAVTAPGPPKAIGKGLLSNGRSPRGRGTLGACHADETSWHVFSPDEGDGPAKWWLWVFIGPDTTCFVMDPTRAGAVLARHAGIDEETGQLADDGDGPRRLVISSDFYSVYTSAGKKADGLVNLYCWAHIRRYFVRAGDANPAQLTYWTAAWLDRIKALYTAHEKLTAAWAGAAAPAPPQAADAAARLEEARAAWDDAIGAIDEARKQQMAAPGLQEPAKKALATLDREWDGLIAHREYPMISLDNNVSERALRRPVVTRKNAYGSRTGDAARLAARIWTVTATAEMAALNVLTYLTAYLDTCGRNGGKPLSGSGLERFLPWNAVPADLRAWAHPPPPG